MASQFLRSQNSNGRQSNGRHRDEAGRPARLTIEAAAEELISAYKRGSGPSIKEEIEERLVDPLVPRKDDDKPDLPVKPLLARIKPPLLYAGVAFLCAVVIFIYLYWRS